METELPPVWEKFFHSVNSMCFRERISCCVCASFPFDFRVVCGINCILVIAFVFTFVGAGFLEAHCVSDI